MLKISLCLIFSVKSILKVISCIFKHPMANWRLLQIQFIMCDTVLTALEWNAAI